MGDQNGGTNQAPGGGVFGVVSNPVTVAGGASGDILNSFNFTFQDGSGTGQLGGLYPGGTAFSFSYSGEIMSSIHINGVSTFYGSADCAVFGFKYEQSQTANPDALRLFYITSPSDVSLNNLAQQSASNSESIAELTTQAAEENWDVQRQAYWQYLKSRATNPTSG
jgi:hypothetical protein